MLVNWAEGQQRSGRLGGTIASRNRFGAYLRAGTLPVNPNTDRQVAVRNAVRSLTIAWHNALTQAQRDAWDVYGSNVSWVNRLGQTVALTGINHYIRSNTISVANGVPRIDIAPIIFNLATAELALAATASEATQDLTIDGDAGGDWIGEAGAWQFYFMGLPQNDSIKFFGGPYRFITAVPGGGPPPFPIVIAGAFPFAADQRLWLRSRVLRADGRLSEFALINFQAIA